MTKECGQSYRFMHKVTETGSQVGLIPVSCKSWSCPKCRHIKADQVKAFIRKHFSSCKVWMLTFTYNRSSTALEAWKNMGENLNRMLTYARKYSGSFNYVRVVEPHKDGSWPHIHMLVDTPIATTTFVKNITNWGFGWNFHCKLMEGLQASNYMSKYLTKEWPSGDADLLRQIARTRIVSSSRKLGPIFKSTSDWSVVKLSNPSYGVQHLLNRLIQSFRRNGATKIDVELFSQGFLVTSDATLSPKFVRSISCPEDWLKRELETRNRIGIVHFDRVPF